MVKVAVFKISNAQQALTIFDQLGTVTEQYLLDKGWVLNENSSRPWYHPDGTFTRTMKDAVKHQVTIEKAQQKAKPKRAAEYDVDIFYNNHRPAGPRSGR